MKKTFSVRTMAEVAIFAALGYVLDFLAGLFRSDFYKWWQHWNSDGLHLCRGVSKGLFPALLVGLIMGLLDIADGFYAIADVWYKAFAQVGLDYWLAYPLVAFAGLFKGMFDRAGDNKHRILAVVYGCALGGILKYIAHILSGVLFWGDYFDRDFLNISNPYLYSIVYNGLYMIPCIILSGAIMIFIVAKYTKVLTEPDEYSLRVASQNKGDK